MSIGPACMHPVPLRPPTAQVASYQLPAATAPLFHLVLLLYRCARRPKVPVGLPQGSVPRRLPSSEAHPFVSHPLCRQPGDEPQDIRLPGSEAMPHKLNEAGAPTDQMLGAARAAFDAKTFAAQHSLGLPVVVHYLQVLS